MSTQPAPVGIVVAVDGSDASRVAVDWAARDAAMRRIPLTLAHVLPSAATQSWIQVPLPAAFFEDEKLEAERILADARALVTAATEGGEALTVDEVVLSGQPVAALVDLAKDAEMLVMGSRGLGKWERRLLGSVSSGVVHHAHCPVAVIHDVDPLIPHPAQAPVVVGVDGSPASEHATAIAFDEASFRGVDLVAVHTWSDAGYELPGTGWAEIQPEEDMLLAERLAGWQERYPDVTVHRVVCRDQPARRLLEEAAKGQLLVVGSHGRGGFGGMLLGSVGSQVVQSARGPVIVARR
ncbi:MULTISPECIES: universal stress protein [Mycolicibacterium]|uniref:UspA domain protein n=1 Tax=Mycolicibacterium vanbaalenii (strain DSM 7251 / JCM 13017 / BCRC 16820 / KCTC 9966 / NRRL B-24157 / PYR-1) TaxID=350058 RepID=A1T6I2_MYCVP|nr:MULTISPECIES: universal stress protein [Mycolicibacterium]ABM12782.1 UspA domain protein [Mycolicibacterium vanbaalenii PYR-1]MCV7126073.1 universal stress protein [Mycolicibacterium vanbaalenii PYR-1]QZT63962.1 universal stress protein [Mycolicibacterium austroafricanum]